MNLTRRFQVLPDYWYCVPCSPPKGGTGPRAEEEAAEHARSTGHEVRVRTRVGEVVLRPESQPAEATR